MILLSGIPTESPLAFLAEALDERGAEYRFFNQRRSADCAIELDVGPEGAEGELSMNGETFQLLNSRASMSASWMIGYCRSSTRTRRFSVASPHRALHDAFYRWFEVADSKIVNRSDPQGSNGSKPYQAQLIARYGLRVPETLITNDPEAVLAFRDRARRCKALIRPFGPPSPRGRRGARPTLAARLAYPWTDRGTPFSLGEKVSPEATDEGLSAYPSPRSSRSRAQYSSRFLSSRSKPRSTGS